MPPCPLCHKPAVITDTSWRCSDCFCGGVLVPDIDPSVQMEEQMKILLQE